MCTNRFYIVCVLDLYIRTFYELDFNMRLKILYFVIMVKASFLHIFISIHRLYERNNRKNAFSPYEISSHSRARTLLLIF